MLTQKRLYKQILLALQIGCAAFAVQAAPIDNNQNSSGRLMVLAMADTTNNADVVKAKSELAEAKRIAEGYVSKVEEAKKNYETKNKTAQDARDAAREAGNAAEAAKDDAEKKKMLQMKQKPN